MAAWSFFLAAAAAAGAPPAGSNQAQFDQAGAAFDKGDYEAALAGFTALETRLASGKNKSILGIVRVRRGLALNLLGRQAEASETIRSGLAVMPAGVDPTGDRAEGLLVIAGIEEDALDFPAARRDYEAAVQPVSVGDNLRLSALAGIARTTMFDDPVRARGAVDQASALLKPDSPKPLVAQLRTLRGRVMLNAGNNREALGELKRAVTELGGLTTKVDRSDIEARSDVAIAALLVGEQETARQYLAYTGAGHTRTELPGVTDLALPPCGEPDGLKPDDVAIIQFAIGDDGAIRAVRPIYASRSGTPALAFARAVTSWSWTPQEVTKIPPFFRNVTRLQLRCSSAQRQPAVLAQLDARIARWLQERGVAAAPGEAVDGAVRALAADRAAIARAEAGAEPLAIVPPLLAVADNPLTPGDERAALVARAQGAIERANAPADIRAAMKVKRLVADGGAKGRSYRQFRAQQVASLRAALQDADVSRDARTAAVVRLTLADWLSPAGNGDERDVLLRQVVEDRTLDPADPLKVGALVRQATLFAERRNMEAARASFTRTGLDAQQCALVDARPALLRNNATSKDFPMDAYRWGFEGWSRQEFDIAADGRTQNVRTIVAYPPFVFEKAGQSVVGKARFQQSYRPAGGLGCSSETQTVAFKLPG